ncbi:MAG TPA: protein-glutamate O-methyltransferase CheR [Clostridiales bacterium]|nr:protein-glutamate O-methyltransferase CheR [Clostridiales bacterium]
MVKLTDEEFNEIAQFTVENYGINLFKKRHLIQSRLNTLLAGKGLTSYSELIRLIKSNNQAEITEVLNRLTTNHTYFFREPEHFEFLKEVILPEWQAGNRRSIRIWSAGCSSGEEAYTTVMVMKNFFGLDDPNWDYRVFATDISTKVLGIAKKAVYTSEAVKHIPESWLKRFFVDCGGAYQLKDEIRRHVSFSVFNLLDEFDGHKGYDLILCRNVMIYFDQELRNRLVNKFYESLCSGGYLFIGHAETIPKGVSDFTYIKPAIYKKA